MSLRPDPWLSGVLGYAAFVVDGDAEEGSSGPAFHWAKVVVEDVARVQRLAAAGFAVVDVNVTLTLDPASACVARRSVEVERARREHAEALLDVAGSCFRYSRFHLDPKIPQEVADRVKREWVRSYLEGRRGVELLAAVEAGRPVGFLAVLEAGDSRVIDLVGVALDAQRRGVGTSLVSAFVERHGPQVDELRVGTQIANVPSFRLYVAQGFTISSAAYVLHRHVEGQ